MNIIEKIRNKLFDMYPVCEDWDKDLNLILDNETPVSADRCILKFEQFDVWIGNYPFAYGSLHRIKDEYVERVALPRIKTRKRLKKFVNNFLKEKYSKALKGVLK